MKKNILVSICILMVFVVACANAPIQELSLGDNSNLASPSNIDSQTDATAPKSLEEAEPTQLKDVQGRIISIYEVSGDATVSRENKGDIPVFKDMQLQSSDKVLVEDNSSLTLRLDEDKFLTLDENTQIELIATGTDKKSETQVKLMKGTVLSNITAKLSKDSVYEVVTPKSTMSVRGTIFSVEYISTSNNAPEVLVNVFDGEVAVQPLYNNGSVTEEATVITSGNSATIKEEEDKGVISTSNTSINLNTLSPVLVNTLVNIANDNPTVISSATITTLNQIIDNDYNPVVPQATGAIPPVNRSNNTSDYNPVPTFSPVVDEPTPVQTPTPVPTPTTSVVPKPTTSVAPKPTTSVAPKPTTSVVPTRTPVPTPTPTPVPKPTPTPVPTPVPPALAEASVRGVNYLTVTEAVNAANANGNGTTALLLKDATIPLDLTISSGAILNLDDKILTVAAGKTLRVQGGITIMQPLEDALTLNAGSSMIIETGASCIILGSSFISSTNSPNATLNMYSGSFVKITNNSFITYGDVAINSGKTFNFADMTLQTPTEIEIAQNSIFTNNGTFVFGDKLTVKTGATFKSLGAATPADGNILVLEDNCVIQGIGTVSGISTILPVTVSTDGTISPGSYTYYDSDSGWSS